MNSHFSKFAVLFLLFGGVSRQGRAQTLVPDGLPTKQHTALSLRYVKATQQKVALNARIDQFNTRCSSVPENSPLAKECEREHTKLEADKARYKEYTDAYEHDLRAAVDVELTIINNRIPNTRRELEKLTPQLLGFQASVDEWTNLADDARNKARLSAKKNTAAALLELLGMKKEKELALDEQSLKRIRFLLLKRTFINDLYAEVLTVKEIDLIKTDLDVIRLLNGVQGVLDASDAVSASSREEVLTGILSGIEIVSKGARVAPSIGLLIPAGEISIDAAYGWLAHHDAGERVNQLLALNENQFKATQSLTALYTKDVRHRKLLLAARVK